MDRNTWMVVRLYLPGLMAIAGALVLTLGASRMGEDGMFGQQLAGAFLLGAKGLLLAAAALWAYTTYRLWRASRGEGVLCGCGGLLGREINGRYGPYRKCMRCSRNVPRRDYEALE
jgi:hypothetical protein